MAAVVPKSVVLLSCKWVNLACSQGDLKGRVIDLLHKDGSSGASVCIPDETAFSQIYPLQFSIIEVGLEKRRDGTYREISEKVKLFDDLVISIETIRSLAIRMGVSKPSQDQKPSLIPLKIHEELEKDQTYDLVVVESEDHSFSAHIVKERGISAILPSVREEESQRSRDRADLFEFLEIALLPLIMAHGIAFSAKLYSLRGWYESAADLDIEALSEKVIRRAIKKIEENTLRTLVARLNILYNQCRIAKTTGRNLGILYDKDILKIAMEKEGLLEDIMRSYLNQFFQEPPHPAVLEYLEGQVNEFLKACKQMTSEPATV